MNAVVAVYSDWGIGDGATQPIVLKADRARFKALTDGSAVIVGRKTLEDFPGGKPLKGRINIVVTGKNIEIENAIVAHSTEEALRAAEQYPDVFVIGGASVYSQFFPYTDRVYITRIYTCPDSNRFFPDLDSDPSWACTDEGPLLEENGISYRFCTYERRAPTC